jgi:uncharacterized protein YbjT (DUF2867 family)
MPDVKRVLLTGATGFVGEHLYPSLIKSGYEVVSGTRDPKAAEKRFRGRNFRQLDVGDLESIVRAMQGCQAAVYLVHSMADHKDYEDAEYKAAVNFARAAERAGLSRIVYLGGPRPTGKVSRHLRSRLRTGETLRNGSVPTIELQATMVIGAGSESWRIVRDLAARLPFMIFPRWLESRSQPIYIEDVAAAFCHALSAELPRSAAYMLPGPDTLSAREIITRTAALLGLQPHTISVPLITPRLSSYWIALVTRANPHIARQLVEGLRTDLVAPDRGYWQFMPEHKRVSFDDAARLALLAEAKALPLHSKLAEWLIHRVTPTTPNIPPTKSNQSDATL